MARPDPLSRVLPRRDRRRTRRLAPDRLDRARRQPRPRTPSSVSVRATLPALALALVVSLAGCGASSSTPAPTTASGSARPTPSATVSPTGRGASLHLVTTATWRHAPEGYRLVVRPSRDGRRFAADAPRRAV